MTKSARVRLTDSASYGQRLLLRIVFYSLGNQPPYPARRASTHSTLPRKADFFSYTFSHWPLKAWEPVLLTSHYLSFFLFLFLSGVIAFYFFFSPGLSANMTWQPYFIEGKLREERDRQTDR